jgi:hypothetical protein
MRQPWPECYLPTSFVTACSESFAPCSSSGLLRPQLAACDCNPESPPPVPRSSHNTSQPAARQLHQGFPKSGSVRWSPPSSSGLPVTFTAPALTAAPLSAVPIPRLLHRLGKLWLPCSWVRRGAVMLLLLLLLLLFHSVVVVLNCCCCIAWGLLACNGRLELAGLWASPNSIVSFSGLVLAACLSVSYCMAQVGASVRCPCAASQVIAVQADLCAQGIAACTTFALGCCHFLRE